MGNFLAKSPNQSMLHQPLRGLDSFATRLRRSTKLPQMQALGVIKGIKINGLFWSVNRTIISHELE